MKKVHLQGEASRCRCTFCAEKSFVILSVHNPKNRIMCRKDYAVVFIRFASRY